MSGPRCYRRCARPSLYTYSGAALGAFRRPCEPSGCYPRRFIGGLRQEPAHLLLRRDPRQFRSLAYGRVDPPLYLNILDKLNIRGNEVNFCAVRGHLLTTPLLQGCRFQLFPYPTTGAIFAYMIMVSMSVVFPDGCDEEPYEAVFALWEGYGCQSLAEDRKSVV